MSVDVFLGLPFNIASYALFTHIVASIVGLEPGRLTFIGGDTHIYSNHVDQCKEMLSNPTYELPTLVMPDNLTLSTLTDEVFELHNYVSCKSITASMAV